MQDKKNPQPILHPYPILFILPILFRYLVPVPGTLFPDPT